MFLLSLGVAAFAAETETNQVSAKLEWTNATGPVLSETVAITRTPKPFVKEPAGLGTLVERGVLKIGREAAEGVPFVWDVDQGQLHFDVNRNRDFTDQEDSTYRSSQQGSYRRQYQSFDSVVLKFNYGPTNAEVLVDLFLHRWQGVSGSISLRSYRQAKVTLAGKDCQIGVIQPLSPDSVGKPRTWLLLRSWDMAQDHFFCSDNQVRTFPLPETLLVEEQGYRVELLAPTAQEPAGRLSFTGIPLILEEVRLAGQSIERLKMVQPGVVALFTAPSETLHVLPGDYVVAAELASGNLRATPAADSLRGFKVARGQTEVLRAGGPLTNVVTVVRQKNGLDLSYSLLGRDGAYELSERANSPRFRINAGKQEVGSGNFEYG
jgi:hypothetical protein